MLIAANTSYVKTIGNPMRIRILHALFVSGLIVLAGSSYAATPDEAETGPASQKSESAHEEIRIPINEYLQGHATGDSSHFRKAFLPTAHVEILRDGKFTSWTLDEYCSFFKGSPASDESLRVRNIDFIDETGYAGVARVTLVHGATTFTDYFLLLKVDGEWKIANKVAYSRKKDV